MIDDQACRLLKIQAKKKFKLSRSETSHISIQN